MGDSSASRLCVLPTHYCNERQRVTMATRRETHVGCSSSLSFFPPPLTFSPHSFLHLVRPPPLAPTRPRDPRPPSFSSPSSSSPVAPSYTASYAPFSPVPSPFDLFRRGVESGVVRRALPLNASYLGTERGESEASLLWRRRPSVRL